MPDQSGIHRLTKAVVGSVINAVGNIRTEVVRAIFLHDGRRHPDGTGRNSHVFRTLSPDDFRRMRRGALVLEFGILPGIVDDVEVQLLFQLDVFRRLPAPIAA